MRPQDIRDTDGTRVSLVVKAVMHPVRRRLEAWQRVMVSLAPKRRVRMDSWCLVAVTLREGEPIDRCLRFASTDIACAMTVGRHPNCALGAPEGSLRHAVVLGHADVTGAGVLEVVDLNSGAGLGLGGGVKTKFVRGHQGLWLGMGSADVLLAWVPPHVELSAAAMEPLAGLWLSDTPLQEPDEDLARADEFDVPSTRSFGSYVRRLADVPGPNQRLGWAGNENSFARMAPNGSVRDKLDRIVHPGAWAELHLVEADIAHGLLLGRYGRCARSTYLAGDEHVSRVHVLIRRVGSHVLAIDTASTAGTVLVRDGLMVADLGLPGPAAALKNGDTLVLGRCGFVVTLPTR